MSPKGARKTSLGRVQTQTASSVDTLVDKSRDLDRQFIIREIDARPDIMSILATMIREGELDRAILRQRYKHVTERLGKALPAKCTKLRHLRPGFWRELFRTLKRFAPDATFEPTGSDADSVPHHEYRDYCVFALGKTVDAPIPGGHAGDGFEGPLHLVLAAQAAVHGDVLSGLTYANRASFGWAQYDSDDPCVVVVGGIGKWPEYRVTLRESAERIKDMSPYLVNNLFLDKLEIADEDEGWSQNILCLLSKQFPDHGLDQNDAVFSHPNAADEYTDVDVGSLPQCVTSPRSAVASGASSHRDPFSSPQHPSSTFSSPAKPTGSLESVSPVAPPHKKAKCDAPVADAQ